SRLLTRQSASRVARFSRVIPLIGGLIGGTVDAAATYAIGKAAKKRFANLAGGVEIIRERTE
ncbi:MAG: hypothetical protein N3A57_02955, partial [Negativicutes bacterium]|nr:hypothetical protein [Negativicutes bacterium]